MKENKSPAYRAGQWLGICVVVCVMVIIIVATGSGIFWIVDQLWR